jgi:hypothetical protein
MISCRVSRKPKGVLLVLAYVVAVPIWILSAPLVAIGGLGAWTARRRQIVSTDTSEA